MKAMNEFKLINMVNTLHDFDLITETQRQSIITKNRKREAKDGK